MSDLKREIARLQEELARYKGMPKNKENRATEFNIGGGGYFVDRIMVWYAGAKSKYLSVAGPDMSEQRES